MRGLYAIVDLEILAARCIEPVAFAEAVLAADPAALQLRAKRTAPREVLSILRALAPLCRRARAPLVANDRPDLALLAGCDMVHVGQTDMAIEAVRRLAPGMGIGVSTHSLDQLDAALAARPSYVAFGPVFETETKRDSDPVVGVAALRQAHLRATSARIPLVAIGGITRDRARSLADAADAVAVIGDLLPDGIVGTPPNAVNEALAEVTARGRAYGAIFGRPPRASASG
jgi:thiamine-phosphate pyrophosphorylase